MDEPVALRTDGPYSPEYTKQVADQVAEGIRVLNYCSMPGGGGLRYPADAYELLALLWTGTQRLPQLFRQLDAFLADQGASGKLGADDGGNVAGLLSGAGEALHNAHWWANGLTEVLQRAQNAIAGLHVKEGADD